MEQGADPRIEPYWSLRYAPKLTMTEDEAAERVEALLSEAVRKRLISDVPLGALLSGGVDSSAVVAFMARHSARPVKTFSIGFEETPYNELPHARRVAERFGCEHHEFIVKPDAIEVLPQLVRHFGEPFADSSAIPTFYLSRLTREHVTVALGGDGGDEVFGGYERHLANRLAEAWQRQPAAVRRCADWVGGRLIPRSADPRGLPAKLRRFLDAAALPRAQRYREWVGLGASGLRAELLVGGGVAAKDGLIAAWFDQARELDAVDAALAVDTRFYLPTDLLVKMDIASMANSLEVRSPLLDHHLVEFVAQLPSALKINGTTLKRLLKRVVSDMVPSANLRQPKRGFAVPVGQWFRHGLRDFLGDHLDDSRLARSGLVRQPALTRLMDEHLRGRADHTRALWALLVLECWHRSQT
jgi:asparagine synthase (glutamine-hydrolysing)